MPAVSDYYEIIAVYKNGQPTGDVDVVWKDSQGNPNRKTIKADFSTPKSRVEARDVAIQQANEWAQSNVPTLIAKSDRQYQIDRQQFIDNYDPAQAEKRKAWLDGPPIGQMPKIGEAPSTVSKVFKGLFDAESDPWSNSYNPPAPPAASTPATPGAAPPPGAASTAPGLPSVDFLAHALLDGKIDATENAAKVKAGDATAIAVQNRALEIAAEQGFFGGPKKTTPGTPATPGAPAVPASPGAPSTTLAATPELPEAPIAIDPTKLDSDEMYNLVKAEYGWAAMYLKDPELGPIIRKAAAEGWGKDEITGAIQNTRWYQQTDETARNWDIAHARDPATQATLVQKRMAQINTGAMALGLTITGVVDLGAYGRYNKAYYMAVQSLREGWTDEQLKTAVLEEGGFDPAKAQNAGVLKAQAYGLKQKAAEYMLPMSDETANRYAAEMLTGKMDEDTFLAILTDQAKMRFPTLAALIDRGATPWKFFDSYRSVIADTLEMDDNQVDFMSPQFSEVLDYVDPNTGQSRFMTLTEARNWAKTRQGWDSTQQAADAAARASKALYWSFDTPGASAGLSPEYSQPWAK